MDGSVHAIASGLRGALDSRVDRRTFLKVTGALASAAGAATVFTDVRAAESGGPTPPPGDPLDDDPTVAVRYTICMMCHSACGQKVKVKDGFVLKIDGNPYHPNCTEFQDGTHASRLAYATDPTSLAVKRIRGRVCAKAQAAIETLYNPYRLKQPLKRVGPRGSGQWQAISWSQAVAEIVGGGTVAGHAFTGLAALRDVATDLSIGGNTFGGELGKVANQVVFSGGRNQHGHKEFTDRMWKDTFGTINFRHDHTSICEASHHIAHSKVTTESRAFSQKGASHIKPDFLNAKYILLFGASPATANFPHASISRKFVDGMKNGAKVAAVDPRFSNTAALAVKNGGRWVPVRPGTDAALAMGLIRHLIETGQYDATFLENATKAAATADSETCWTDATYLVRRDNGQLLDAAVLGGTAGNYVCKDKGTGAFVEVDPDSTVSAVEGVLDADGVSVGGVTCDSVLNLVKKESQKQTLSQYEQLCGLTPGLIATIGDEFAAAGKQAVAELYRGVVEHTNGTYSALAIIYLNLLAGNLNHKGGAVFGGSHWHELGEGKTGTLYDLKGGEFNGTKVSPSGPYITRVKGNNITDFPTFFAQGPDLGQYPTRRPWFPQAGDYNYQEVIPSMAAQYPYPCRALVLYWNNNLYSTPGARNTAAAMMADESKFPLIVAIDIEMGETTAMADYILPDTTYLETWATPHDAPTILTKTSGIRNPVVGDVWDGAKYVPISQVADIATTLDTFGDPMWGARPYYRPLHPDTRPMEDILLTLFASPQGIVPNNDASLPGHLPGVGLNGFGPGQDFTKAWHWFRRMIANVAFEDLPGAGVEGSGNEQANVNYVLARGGRFEDGSGLAGAFVQHTKSLLMHFYIEEFLGIVNSQTGLKDFPPLGHYSPVRDVRGNVVDDSASFPLHLITYKDSFHSMARTIVNPSLVGIIPENFIEMNTQDAAARGIVSGDLVQIGSASNTKGLQGRAYVSDDVRPGVVAIRHSYGHWEMSSRPHVVSGVQSGFDPGRAVGISMNPIARLDPALGDVSLQDPVGGSVAFYDTQVEIAKV